MKEQDQPPIAAYPPAGHQPSPYPDDALLYRIPTAEAKLEVSRSTIYRLVNDGELVLIKVGKRASRITAASLHAFIERNKALTTS